MKKFSTFELIVMGSLLAILVFVMWLLFFKGPTEPVPYDNTILTEVLQRQLVTDSLVREALTYSDRKQTIISSRDTFVLRATERTVIKYIQDEKKINATPTDMQPAITKRLHARYDRRRSEESK